MERLASQSLLYQGSVLTERAAYYEWSVLSQSLLYQGSVLTEEVRHKANYRSLNPFFIRAPF